MNHRPHFPVAILTLNGNLILAAAAKRPEIADRLPEGYLADTTAVLTKVTADVSGQKSAKSELGTLTRTQTANLDNLQHYMNQARQTAKLAFPGRTVKLRQEFQVGVAGPYDLGSVLARADILFTSVQTPANLAALKAKGWSDADTAAYLSVRGTFPTSTQMQQSGKSGAKDATTVKNLDAGGLYERLLTIQNAADLQWPATDPANAGVRDEFRLNTFPPDNHAAPPTPPPTPPAAPAK